jgi:hypothetical protein
VFKVHEFSSFFKAFQPWTEFYDTLVVSEALDAMILILGPYLYYMLMAFY